MSCLGSSRQPGAENSNELASTRQRPKNVPPAEHQATDGRRLLQLNEQGQRRMDVVGHVFRFGCYVPTSRRRLERRCIDDPGVCREVHYQPETDVNN
jgi:hypothetical protein